MFLTMNEYLLIARKMLKLYGYPIKSDDDDAITDVATAMMNADATWDGKSSSRLTWRYNNACYEISHIKKRRKRQKKHVSLSTPIHDNRSRKIRLADIIINKKYLNNDNFCTKELINMILEEAKNILSRKQYQCFCLYYLDDMTMEEIGQKFGITRQAVSLHIISATKRVKDECLRKFSHIYD